MFGFFGITVLGFVLVGVDVFGSSIFGFCGGLVVFVACAIRIAPLALIAESPNDREVVASLAMGTSAVKTMIVPMYRTFMLSLCQ
ncbi:MAG: hypothetical protein DPW22_01510 [Alphaproteobacteria bacterium]|nr:hypothetical protein [Alphaproteobacteria bacterium]